MSALQFLNKKSWHTSTIKNNEKVWLKEQEAERENKRIEELQKQLAEERKLQEIQRLEEQSGRLDPAELLKRRRLNWMYEQGTKQNDDAKKEKETDDMLLGRKQVNLDQLQESTTRVNPADEEAKMREDPLVKIQIQRANALRRAGRDPSLPIDKHRHEKLLRKQQRANIREERRVKRERRALKRSREERGGLAGQTSKRSRESDEESNGRSVAKKKSSHELKMRELRAKEQRLLSRREKAPANPPVEKGSAINPLARRDLHAEGESLRHSARSRDAAQNAEGDRYGLSLPADGSGVKATREFVPRRNRRLSESGEAGRRERDRARKIDSETRNRRSAGCRYENSGVRESPRDRERKLSEMKREADEMFEERISRSYRSNREERDEREQRPGRADPGRSFAREYILSSSRTASRADHVNRRRAWTTRDDDARY